MKTDSKREELAKKRNEILSQLAHFSKFVTEEVMDDEKWGYKIFRGSSLDFLNVALEEYNELTKAFVKKPKVHRILPSSVESKPKLYWSDKLGYVTIPTSGEE